MVKKIKNSQTSCYFFSNRLLFYSIGFLPQLHLLKVIVGLKAQPTGFSLLMTQPKSMNFAFPSKYAN